MVTTYFCPRCWYQDSQPLTICPCCGHDLSLEHGLTYEERLLLSLSHPIREQRMIAMEILGKLRCQKAIPLIGKMLETEKDYYLIREGMQALLRIGGSESISIITLFVNHPSPLIRKLAEDTLSRMSSSSSNPLEDPGNPVP